MNYSQSENNSSTGHLYSKDHTPLFYRHYAVSGQKATILLVHGFGEHSGRYTHVVDQLRKRHFEVYCLDFRGHGRSEGRRGDVEAFARFEEDLDAAIQFVHARMKPGQKLFILAHSMGALVTLRLISEKNENIAGMVLSAPLFGLNMPIPTWKRVAACVLMKIMPTLGFKSSIKGSQLTTDAAISRAYDNDPLVNKTISLRAFHQIEESLKGTDQFSIKPSFFMQVAGSDSVVDSKAAVHWFNNLKKQAADREIKIYPDFLHEIYNESRREESIGDAIRWIEKRV